MKNSITLFFLGFIGLVFFSSCEEEGPLIILEAGQEALTDTCYISSDPISATPKNVLFEEFSGVRCANCPAGNLEAHNIVVANPDRVIPVTIHSQFLANPYSGTPDLRNEDADLIANTLGPVTEKPSSFINRKVIMGRRLVGSLGSWSGLVDAELTLSAEVNLNLEIVAANEAERTIRYKVTISYPQDASSHNLGFYLTESEIIAKQLDGSVKIDDYEHEFVLRKSLGPIVGDPLVGCDLVANTVIVKEFSIDLDDEDLDPNGEWNIAHMDIVAFIRQGNEEIVNAAGVTILP